VTGGAENRVGAVAVTAFEVVSPEVAFALHVSDDGLDGGASPELALDGAVHAAALTREIDAERVGRVVALVSLVDVDALGGDAGERCGVREGGGERVAVVWVAVDRLGVDDELAAG
jgi:hypothetical protein